MDAKEYLSQALWLDRIINNKLEQQEEVRAKAERTTVDISQEKVCGGNITKSPMEDSTVKLADLSREIDDYVDRYVNLKVKIQNTISKLSDFRYILILEMRYLNNKAWDDIAMTIGYDTRYTMKLHRKALNEVRAILKEDTKRHLLTE